MGFQLTTVHENARSAFGVRQLAAALMARPCSRAERRSLAMAAASKLAGAKAAASYRTPEDYPRRLRPVEVVAEIE